MAGAVACATSNALAEEGNQLVLDSLLGKYEGRMQVHNNRQTEFSYQTEVISVENKSKTVSLINYCQECEIKIVKRNDCPAKETIGNITFICKGKFGDEQYIFNGELLKATGVGAKNTYAITVKKVSR
jgi:hypothetical protein